MITYQDVRNFAVIVLLAAVAAVGFCAGLLVERLI